MPVLRKPGGLGVSFPLLKRLVIQVYRLPLGYLVDVAPELKRRKAILEHVSVESCSAGADWKSRVEKAEAKLLVKGARWPQLRFLKLAKKEYDKKDFEALGVSVPAWGRRGTVDVSRFDSAFRYVRDLR